MFLFLLLFTFLWSYTVYATDMSTTWLAITWMHLTGQFVSWSSLQTGLAQADLFQDPEYKEIIHWLRDEQIITSNTSSFRPYDPITRQEAAKILGQFYSRILWYTGIVGIQNDCTFVDITETDYTLTDYVKSSCKMGLIKWSKAYFHPTDHMSTLQMIVILVRMFENKLMDETQDPRYLEYLLQARWYGIPIYSQDHLLQKDITRYDLVLTLYRYYLRQHLIQNLNKAQSRTKMIVMVPNTISSMDGHTTSRIMIDMSQFDQNINYRPTIDLFDDTYAMRQTKITFYPELKNSFVWYGDLLDIWSEKSIWTASFVIFNNKVEFATMRKNDSRAYYKIQTYQAGYYTLIHIKA